MSLLVIRLGDIFKFQSLPLAAFLPRAHVMERANEGALVCLSRGRTSCHGAHPHDLV